MKKLILLLFTIILISNINVREAYAVAPEGIQWTCDNTYTEKAMQGYLYFGADATSVTINLPENSSGIWDNGNHILKVTFYDANDQAVDAFEVPEFFGSETSYEYDYLINFDVLDIDEDSVYLIYTIPLALGEACDSNWLIYYNDGSSSTINYEPTPYGIFDWYFFDNPATTVPTYIYSYDYTYSNEIAIPEGTTTLNLDKGSLRIKWQSLTFPSYIDFYEDGAILASYELCELAYESHNIVGDCNYNTTHIDIDLTLLDDYNLIDGFRIREMHGLFIPTFIAQKTLFWSYNFDNAILPTVNFIIDGVVDFSRLSPLGTYVSWSGGFPSKVGYTFVEWILYDGTPYIYPNVITEEYLEGTDLNIYATFREIPVDLVGDVDVFIPDEDSGFTVALTKLGFNDPIERTIVFGFLAILTALALLFKGVNTFAILIVVGCELMFFVYLGIIPLFIAIIIGLALVLVGFSTMGGATNE